MALDFSRSDDKKKKGDKKKKVVTVVVVVFLCCSKRCGIEHMPQTMSRPFGVALLVAGVDSDNGPQLFMADPSGSYTK